MKILGRKLSSTSVFEFSTRMFVIDPSALAGLNSSSSGNKPDSTPSSFNIQLSVPDYLTIEEARASVVVLMYKLVFGGTSVFGDAVTQLLDIINGHDQILTINLDFNRKEDIDLLTSCWSDITVTGICALLDYTATSLSTLADAVAALSWEALKAETSIVNRVTDSGGDCLRSVCKSIQSTVNTELSFIPLVNRLAGMDLTSCLFSLVWALHNLGARSWLRAELCFESLLKDNKYPDLAESFTAQCPNVDQLNSFVESSATFMLENNYIRFVHEVYSLSESVRKIICWEVTLSFITLEESVSKDYKNGGVKPLMGKGTTELMQYIRDKLHSDTSDVEVLSQRFLCLFDFRAPGSDHLLQRFKSIEDRSQSVTSNLDDAFDPGLDDVMKTFEEFLHNNDYREGDPDFPKKYLREKVMSIVADVFEMHGAKEVNISFPLRNTPTGRVIIPDLTDEVLEPCYLRFSSMKPFARLVAASCDIKPFRRYHLARLTTDNQRVFYLCNYDIAGETTVLAEVELVHIFTQLFHDLNIGNYVIKMNHRKFLDAMLDMCGVPSFKYQLVYSTIGKLSRQSFEQIRMELIEDNGLDAETVDKIGSFVLFRGPPLKILSELKKDFKQAGDEFPKLKQALENLEEISQALNRTGLIDKVLLDCSLASAVLPEYTGVIYEVVSESAKQDVSLAVGGRYDNLVAKLDSEQNVAAIGFTIKLEHVFTMIEQNQLPRFRETKVVVSILKDDSPLVASVVEMCLDKNLKAEFMLKRDDKHFERVKGSEIPWMVIVGDPNTEEGHVKIKDMENNADYENVPASGFVDKLITLMNTPISN